MMLTSEMARQYAFDTILSRFFKTRDEDFFPSIRRESESFKWESNGIESPEDFILRIYRGLDEISNSDGKKVPLPPLFTGVSGWQNKTILNLQRRLQHLASYVHAAILHGSFGSNDANAFSDLDVQIILSAKVFENRDSLAFIRKELRALHRLCFKIDPLAHHGFMFTTPYDLRSYPSIGLPYQLFSYGRTLVGENELDIQEPALAWRGRIHVMNKKILHFEQRLEDKNITQDIFHFKNDIAQFFIWPSLLLEAHGVYVYKKDSFDEAKWQFPQYDWSSIDEASAIRDSWRQRNPLRYFPDALMLKESGPAVVAVSLCRRYVISRPSPVSRKRATDLFRRFLSLARLSVNDTLKHYGEI